MDFKKKSNVQREITQSNIFPAVITWPCHALVSVRSMSKLIIFHLPAYLYYLYVVVYDLVNIEEGSSGFGGKFKYLTIWNAVIIHEWN